MRRTIPVNSPAPELHSGDLPLRDLPALESNDDLRDRSDIITATEAELAAKDYLDELAFMSQPVTIRVHKGRERNPRAVIDVYVNGVAKWIPTDRDVTVPRSYVEVLARAQPYEVETVIDKNEGRGTDAPVVNEVRRHMSSAYAFSVLHDPSPKGAAWLAKVMRES